MKCPSCGMEFIDPRDWITSPDIGLTVTTILEVEDVIYNRERPVIGLSGDTVILTTYNFNCVDNDTVISATYQCKECGAELAPDLVRQAVKEWRR